jgi:hypothetical protein
MARSNGPNHTRRADESDPRIVRYGPIEVDSRFFPVVIVRHQRPASDDDFARYLEQSERDLARADGRSITILVGTGQNVAAPATQRAMQGAWLKRNAQRLARHSLGTCFVIDAAIVRGGMTAVLWLARMPTDYEVVGTARDAIAWVKSKLAQAGLPFPDELQATDI